MIAALFAAVIIGVVIAAATNPLWLGLVTTRAIDFIPFPVSLELTVAAISLARLHGIRIIFQHSILLSIDNVALSIWPLRVSVSNVRGRFDFSEDASSLKWRANLPEFLRPLLPYVLAIAVKLLSFIQIEVNSIELQVFPKITIFGRQYPRSVSIQQIGFKTGRTLYLNCLYCQAFNSTASVNKLEADIPLSLDDGKCLTASVSDIQVNLLQRFSVILSAVDLNITNNYTDVILHIITASAEKTPFCFLGEIHLHTELHHLSPSMAVFGVRVHLDPVIEITSTLQQFLNLMPMLNLPKLESKLSLYSADIQVTALKQTLILAYVEELEVLCISNYVIFCRNVRSRLNSNNIIRVSSISLNLLYSNLLVEVGNVIVNAHLELVKILLPMTQLALSFASSIPKSQAPSLSLNVDLAMGAIQVSLPRMFDVNIKSAKIDVSQQKYVLLLMEPGCFYDSDQFLSFSFVKLIGQKAASNFPHPSFDVSADAARGHWYPPMQYELLYLIKEIIAAVIRCKRDLYPLLFPAYDQLSTPEPIQVARGLPRGKKPFYDWAFRDRAPYLVEKLQIVSLCVSDILITAAIESSMMLTIYAERFLSEFIPWHWHLSRFAICLESFPLFHLLSLDISRDCDCPDADLFGLKRDPGLTEQTAKLLLYSPIRVSTASVSIRIPNNDSSLYDSIDPVSILYSTRALVQALSSIPTLDELALQDDGPGYRPPPDFELNPVVHFRCRHLSLFLIDSCWDSWIHQVRPVGLDERMGSDSRRELLRLKIREHQRRTGQLLSDAKISLMSSRLAESNFELYRDRIVRLKAAHAEKWTFPHLDCISEDLRPGNFRLGSLLSVSISDLVCKTQIGTTLDCQEPSGNLLIGADCSLQSETLEVSLRQFCPSVIDISKLCCNAYICIQQDSFGPTRLCDLNLSPRHRIQFTLPLYPPLISIRVRAVQIFHSCIILSPSIITTLKDVFFLFRKLRPSFIDPAVKSLSILDVVRYIVDVQEVDNVLVNSFSVRILQQMAFCTSTDSPSHPSLLIKGSGCRAGLSSNSESFSFSVEELTIELNDERDDSRTKVHMSHESVYKPEQSDGSISDEFYETGVLLQCFRIDCSVDLRFISADGVPCTTRCMNTQSNTGADPFETFRTSRIAVTLKFSSGSSKHQTKMMLNTHNLPFLLFFRHLPAFSMPDFSALQLSCSQLSLLNCSFTLLDAANNDDPGQGLRFHLAEIRSKFDVNLCAIHNLYIGLSALNASLVANESFWRKCESGHELSHDIRNGTVVVVHAYENQRFILGQGWLGRLLPTDRPNWSDIDGTQELRRDCPLFDLPSEHWQWKSDWVIDRGQICGKGKVDPDGWEYAHDFPRTYTANRHWTDNVRRRRWFRVRQLIDSVDKNIRTNIEEKRNRRQNGLLFLVDSCQIGQKSCSTLILRTRSPVQSQSKLSPLAEPPKLNSPNQISKVSSLLTFFSIGTQSSPTAVLYGNTHGPDSLTDGNLLSPDESLSSSPYLFSVKIVNPRARMTLESRNSLVQLFRAYMLHFEYYFRLRSAPVADNANLNDDKDESNEMIFSADENSDDDEVDQSDNMLVDFTQTEYDNVQPISQTPPSIADNPEPDSINPVDLLDIVSIEILNGQIALESPVERACGIVLACMQSCLVTARSFDGDGSKQESERIDIRLLTDNLTIRLAPTDIDVDAKPMWFDFKEFSSQSVMKAIVDPFPIQASAMLYPFSSSPHSVFLLLPTISATLNHLQCALLESIIMHVVLAELPLPPLQSATEFVQFSFAGLSACDGRITSHQRILWQVRHLEWLMEVYHASDLSEEEEGKLESEEFALLSAHLSSLRQQFVDSIMSVSVDLRSHLSATFSVNTFDIHFRLEAFVLSLVCVNRVEFVRITVAACSGLVQMEFKGEGSLQLCFDIRDVRVFDTRTDMEDWKNVIIPAYLCGSNGLPANDPNQNAENRAVMTLQCIVKRVGGIVVICSCVLNVAHLVIRITQTLIDDLSEFITKQSTSKAERKMLQRGAGLVPKVSGILAEVDHPEPPSPSPERLQEGSGLDESTPAHLRDLRLYCERSQNSIIITFLRIGPFRATISFKGSGSSGIADFQGVSVRMSAMVYQKKTWTLKKFARRLRRDLVKAALRQAGPGLASFLKYKFGGTSADMGSFSYGSHEDLNALDIDLPVGSIPIQPSPHPIAKGKAAVDGIITKFKSSTPVTGDSNEQADEVKDPEKRYLLFGKPTSQ